MKRVYYTVYYTTLVKYDTPFGGSFEWVSGETKDEVLRKAATFRNYRIDGVTKVVETCC